MRVALVTDFYAPRRGGIEAQVRGLAGALAAAGHAVRVVTAWPGPDELDGIEVIRLRAPRLGLPVAPFAPGLRRAVDGVDVIHAHASTLTPLAWRAARLGRPAVLSFHSLPGPAARAFPSLRGALPVAVSAAVAAELGRLGEVRVVPNAIDCGAWAGPRAPEGGPHVVAATRFTPRKRPLALVDALAAAARRLPDLRATVAGDGPLRGAVVRAVRRRGLAGRVTLAGWLAPAQLAALYRTADAFLHVTTREAFGLAVLEARAAGLPVVVRGPGGPAGLVRHGVDGWVAPRDEGLVDGLVALDPAWGEAARVDAARYDHAVVRPRWEALYAEAAG